MKRQKPVILTAAIPMDVVSSPANWARVNIWPNLLHVSSDGRETTIVLGSTCRLFMERQAEIMIMLYPNCRCKITYHGKYA